MLHNERYIPESAADLFSELEAALALRPAIRRVYSSMSQTFKKCLYLKTAQTGIQFGGDFAMTDYLLKEYGAAPWLVQAVNDTRTRLRRRYELTDEELERNCLIDWKNLCLLVGLVYATDIPAQMAALFPTEKVTAATHQLVGECMRVIVERWDDEMVYVRTEQTDGGETKVCYAHGNKRYNFDWSYLKRLFYKGAQLNLVRPREDDGIIWPELIIFEPDYLVNISTVAHCFTNYAESPLVDIIRRLEPQQATEATVLGNFAGQLLDEAIRQPQANHTYKDSVATFFKDHAMELLAAGISQQFHQEAQRQQQHIWKAIRTTLPSPQVLGRFRPEEGIVEPSFISEMLGLQGRMDYLQQDFRVLMEQKSGKGAFPYNQFQQPRQTDEHYVQMLLYMAVIRYNYRSTYERNGRELHAFLLYSKYSESLLALGFAPELIFKAIKMRNSLAWTDLHCTQPGGYQHILDLLTPERLNEKQATGTLWNVWQRPKIAAILDPIRQATETERAYYYRFLTFIANEHAMAKMGNRTKECSGFASTWNDSLEEKRQAGNIYDRLALTWPDETTKGRIQTVELKFHETEAGDMSNFRVGDIVILYPYPEGREPDARRTIVFRCSIEDIQTDRIQLTLRAAQSDSRAFTGKRGMPWAIEHDFMESSFSPLYRGMHSFLTAPKSRRDLLMLQRKPETDTTLALKGNYGNFNTLALKVKQAKDLFLIIGPPGTGKTSYGMLNTVKEELLEPETNILVLSYTNRAVDEICSKLAQEGIDFIRIGGAFSCADSYRDKLLSTKVEHCSNSSQLKDAIIRTRVIVGTTTSLNSHIALFQMKPFSLAVIDEASQILEPHLMGLLCARYDDQPAIRKLVFIGDHKQLPAVVQQEESVSRVDNDLLKSINLTDCRLSLFERLLKCYGKDESVTYMLRKQGRMHQDIALFPNMAFYDNQLEVVPLSHQLVSLPQTDNGQNGIDNLLRTRRIIFIDADVPKDSPSDKVNQTEANMIAAMVERIFQKEKDNGFDTDKTVGVIVPYRNQITTVRNAIDHYGIPLLHDITIDTVERFQGSQRKYIIYGFTVQKYYQLAFLTSHVFEDEIDGCIVDRKLNVAMTRAEEHLLMVGNARLLAHNLTFYKLMEFVRNKNGFFRVAESDFTTGRFDVNGQDATK